MCEGGRVRGAGEGNSDQTSIVKLLFWNGVLNVYNIQLHIIYSWVQTINLFLIFIGYIIYSSGAFGKVFRGKMKKQDSKFEDIAIKTIKSKLDRILAIAI